jgi:hypothetical protein
MRGARRTVSASKFFMRKLILMALLTTLPAAAQPSHPINTLRDRNRVLIIFSSESGDPLFQKQLELLKPHNAEMAERDLVTIPVLGTWRTADSDLRAKSAIFTNNREQSYLRERYKIKPESFTVILLGKDGGEKLRTHEPIPFDKLAQTIDSMPMRQQEMQKPH